MANDGTQTKPARKAFNQSKHAPDPPAHDQKPVTKAELNALEAQREKPGSGRQFAPGGEVRRNVAETMRRQREDRITNIRQRLGRVKNRARGDFDRGR